MEEAQWWDEDAERLNAMAAVAKAMEVVVDVEEGEAPELTEDGALADVDED